MKFFKALGLLILYVFLTFVFLVVAGYIFNNFLGFSEATVYGSIFSIIILFWGGYLLSQKGYKNTIGIIIYTIGVLYNFMIIASPYDTREEYAATRILILFSLASGIFLRFRPGKVSKMIGMLIIIISILSMLLGAAFLWMKTPLE